MNGHVIFMSKRENKSKPHDGDDDPQGTNTKGAARTDLHCSPTVCGTIQEEEEAAAAAAAAQQQPGDRFRKGGEPTSNSDKAGKYHAFIVVVDDARR
jgi:hypothetical protein